jgi:hypothetical protein
MATAAQRYRALESDRNYYLERGREAARLTLPYLVPSSNEPTKGNKEVFPLPWNGIGARGVLNLASRMLLALLPPTQSFFRFTLNEMEMIRQNISLDQKSEFDSALAKMEQEVLRSIESTNDRVAFHEALLWLIVCGNVLLYVGKEGLRVHHLNRYVCCRDPMGNPLEVVTCEELAVNVLPPEIKALLEDDKDDLVGKLANDDYDEIGEYDQTVKIYTHVRWEKTRVVWHQEVKGKEIPGSQGEAPMDSNPWMPLRMSRVDGQPYGVGYVESAALADLKTAEALSQAVSEGSLASAAIRFLVRPNGVTKAKALAEAANGAFVVGDINDVQALQVQKGGDMQVAMAGLARVEARLSQAFMLADVRDSERTTAEEVRLQALQIENSLGSIYSILTTEFQTPYVSRKLDLLIRQGKLEPLPKDLIRPVVSVGLAAVGRSNDLEKVVRFVSTIAELGNAIGQQEVMMRVNPSELIRRLAASMGVDTVGLIKTDQEVAAEREQAQQLALAQQAMASPMADPQKQAQAAAIEQQMAANQPTEPQAA